MGKVIALPRRAPAQRPGLSRQDYETPRDFLSAVEARFGALEVDLAASRGQEKAPLFVTPQENSLAVDWARFAGKTCWLNPPFDTIGAWAEKCRRTIFELPRRGLPRTRILFLTPASIGSNWFAEHVHGRALVLALQGRLSFDGKAPYPKDCMLSVFGAAPGFDIWKWKEAFGP